MYTYCLVHVLNHQSPTGPTKSSIRLLQAQWVDSASLVTPSLNSQCYCSYRRRGVVLWFIWRRDFIYWTWRLSVWCLQTDERCHKVNKCKLKLYGMTNIIKKLLTFSGVLMFWFSEYNYVLDFILEHYSNC